MHHTVPAPVIAEDVVYVVDGDAAFREHLTAMLVSRDVHVIAFSAPDHFLSHVRRDTAACLVLHHQPERVDGLALQRQLAARTGPPVIFVSGEHDVSSAVQALKAGAIDVLTDPVDAVVLLESITTALTEDRLRRERTARLRTLQDRFAALTPRERQVMPLVCSGLLNKQVASRLGIAVVTVQIHRGQIMRKMAAGSLAELVRMTESLAGGHHVPREQGVHDHGRVHYAGR